MPSSGTFRVLIDTEIVKVTGVSGSTWTIVRGDDGSTAASHTDGTTAYIIVTKAALNALVSIQSSDTEVSNQRILDFDGNFTVTDDSGNSRCKIAGTTFGEIITPPAIGSFTFDGHGIAGTPTATQQGNSIYMYQPGTASDAIAELYMSPPATPYSVAVKITVFCLKWGFTSCGPYFGDGTKEVRICKQIGNDEVTVEKYTNTTTFSSTAFSQAATLHSPMNWFKIRDDGTNKSFYISPDGINWYSVYSESSTAWLATTTRIGISFNGGSGGTSNTGRTSATILHSWKIGT